MFRGFGRRSASRLQRASHGWWAAAEHDPTEDGSDYRLDNYPDNTAGGATQQRWTADRAWTGAPPGAEAATDPRGFPPVGRSEPPGPCAPAGLDATEAAALAAAFATDYLSWDEADPHRRGRVIAHYLAQGGLGNDPDTGADPARLGWSGRGRQRADFALAGAVRSDGDGRVTVDVRVRVTPYLAVGAVFAGPPEDELEVAGVPAAAPAPTARGWKSLGSYWVRLSVPIARERGRLVVDASDEQLGNRPPPPAGSSKLEPAAAEAPDVDGDDVGTPGVAGHNVGGRHR